MSNERTNKQYMRLIQSLKQLFGNSEPKNDKKEFYKDRLVRPPAPPPVPKVPLAPGDFGYKADVSIRQAVNGAYVIWDNNRGLAFDVMSYKESMVVNWFIPDTKNYGRCFILDLDSVDSFLREVKALKGEFKEIEGL